MYINICIQTRPHLIHNCRIKYMFGVSIHCSKTLLVIFNNINRNVATFSKFLFNPLVLSYFVDRFDPVGLLCANSK